MTRQPHSVTARLLAALLGYPDESLRACLPQLRQALQDDTLLSGEYRAALGSLIDGLREADPLDAEARYVDTFDRGRRTSLHLFEHVHGDSRERGPALIDLQQTYAQQGLFLAPGELPDYLPAVLEFVSMQPYELAMEFLGEIAHLLQLLHAALVREESPYAAGLAALLNLAGEPVQAVGSGGSDGFDGEKPSAEPELDEQWAEPAAFGACSTSGQSAAPHVQTIQVVRRDPALDRSTPSEGALA